MSDGPEKGLREEAEPADAPSRAGDGLLADTNVVLGVCGSIAAVKTVELAHELRRHGATVQGVMTDSATGILHPWAVEFATRREPVTEITGQVEHVELCGRDGWGDVLVIAPATANTVGKIAGAIDDSTVTTCATTALGADVPTVVVPAMHEPMYDHPGVMEAQARLAEWGVSFVDPRIEEGKAKMAGESAIVTETARAAGASPLEGTTVVVTSGATSEPLDPVRVVTNRASGKTGRAVARACYAAGGSVVVIHDGPAVPWADDRQVETAAEMTDAAVAATEDADWLISAAAVADYTTTPADEKIRSGSERLTVEFEPTRKLLDTVRERRPDVSLVGFKAETDSTDDQLIERARTTLERAGCAFVVANDAAVMGATDTRALLVEADTVTEHRGSKLGLGSKIAARIGSHTD